MYNHNKAQQGSNRVHISWDILYVVAVLQNSLLNKMADIFPTTVSNELLLMKMKLCKHFDSNIIVVIIALTPNSLAPILVHLFTMCYYATWRY